MVHVNHQDILPRLPHYNLIVVCDSVVQYGSKYLYNQLSNIVFITIPTSKDVHASSEILDSELIARGAMVGFVGIFSI